MAQSGVPKGLALIRRRVRCVGHGGLSTLETSNLISVNQNAPGRPGAVSWKFHRSVTSWRPCAGRQQYHRWYADIRSAPLSSTSEIVSANALTGHT